MKWSAIHKSLSLWCVAFQRYLSHMLYHDDKRDCTRGIRRIRVHCHAVASCCFSLNMHFFDVFGTQAVHFHSTVNVIGNQFLIIRTAPTGSCIWEDGEKKKKILYSFGECKWFGRHSLECFRTIKLPTIASDIQHVIHYLRNYVISDNRSMLER